MTEPSYPGCVKICTHHLTVPHAFLKNTSPLPKDHCGFSPRSLWDYSSSLLLPCHWCEHTGRENGSACLHCCGRLFIQCRWRQQPPTSPHPACTVNTKLWLNMRKNKMAAGENTTTRRDHYITPNLREWCSRSTFNLSHMFQEFTPICLT